MWRGHRIVQWSLQQECPLRSGKDWFLPEPTSAQLGKFRHVAYCEGQRSLFDGLLARGVCATDAAGNKFEVATGADRLADYLGSEDRWEQAKCTCRKCPANVDIGLSVKVAGCFGTLDLWPDSPGIERALRRALDKFRLNEQFSQSFLETTPLWYGLWVRSPLSGSQVQILRTLFEEVVQDDATYADFQSPYPYHNEQQHRRISGEIGRFIAACQVSLDHRTFLHVELPPREERRAGWKTICAYCPRCRADVDVRHSLLGLQTPYLCPVCGHRFVPHNKEVPWDPPSPSQRAKRERVLTKKNIADFARRYIQHQGGTREQANEVLEKHFCDPIVRRVFAVRWNQYCSREVAKRARQEDAREKTSLPSQIDFELGGQQRIELVLVEPDTAHANVRAPFYISPNLVTPAQVASLPDRRSAEEKGRRRLPAGEPNWFDCHAFCEELCRRFNRLVRLPSEAELEIALGTGHLQSDQAALEWCEDAWFTRFEEAGPETAASLNEDHRKAYRVTKSGCSRVRVRADGKLPKRSGVGTLKPFAFRIVCEV